ncbi:MAG: hypothetical protein U5L45_07595 [Saprospiraceae bacterium]|nr:hypothetical protein [Saprospiraceae bacterium]
MGGRRGGSFFGQSPKNEPPLLPRASEASYGLSNYAFSNFHTKNWCSYPLSIYP